jgi:hypothetical protein
VNCALLKLLLVGNFEEGLNLRDLLKSESLVPHLPPSYSSLYWYVRHA